MDLDTFIHQRGPGWKKLDQLLQRVEGSGLGVLDEEQAVEFGRLYRSAASDLNQAQTFLSGDETVRYLNSLVARCYVVVHSRARVRVWSFLRSVLLGFPAAFRRCFRHVLLAAAILFGGALFGFAASWFDVHGMQFLFPDSFNSIMPESEEADAARPVSSTGELQAFSSHLFTNNLRVSLLVFALGLTFGIGTAWLLWYNGILLGALAAVFVQAGQLRAFCTGVLPHGAVEIPAILIGGAAGFVVAQAMIEARPWSRLDELARRGSEALLLVSGCIPLLMVAAVIEAGVARAPDWFISSGAKLAVSALVFAGFVVYVLLPPGESERKAAWPAQP